MAELRHLLPRMEGREVGERGLPFAVPALDTCLPHGGLAFGALHEVMPASGADMAAALGFVCALLSRVPQGGPVLLVTLPRKLAGFGRLHGHGLNGLGLDPSRLILVEAKDSIEALWAMEEALRSAVLAAVAGWIAAGLDLKTSRRLHLAAQASGCFLLLLRPEGAAGASAAMTRWRIRAAETRRDRFGLMVGRRWHVELTRCRNGRSGDWLMEWDHAAHRFGLAAAMANSALPCSPGEEPPALRREYRS